jgi:hypothetical protein
MPSAVTFARGRSGTAEGAERITRMLSDSLSGRVKERNSGGSGTNHADGPRTPNAGETLPLLPAFRPSAFDPLTTAYIMSIATCCIVA